MEKKYILTDNKRTAIGPNNEEIIVYRIMALRDIGDDVNKGDLGGFIEKEENLSHNGECWVFDNAYVYENARIIGDAEIKNNAEIYGNAIISEDATVCDDAEVFGDAKVSGFACICNDSKVYRQAKVEGNVRLCGMSCVSENAEINGDAIIEDAEIYGSSEITGNVSIKGKYKIYGNSSIFGNTKIINSDDTSNIIKDSIIEGGDIYNSAIIDSEVYGINCISSSILSGSTIKGIHTCITNYSRIKNADMINCKIDHCDLQYCNLDNSDIEDSKIYENINILNAEIKDNNYISINNLFDTNLLIYFSNRCKSELIIRLDNHMNYTFDEFLNYINKLFSSYTKRRFMAKFIKVARLQLLKK